MEDAGHRPNCSSHYIDNPCRCCYLGRGACEQEQVKVEEEGSLGDNYLCWTGAHMSCVAIAVGVY